jgi:hypothetical protein
LTLAGQLQQGAVPRIGPWVLVGHDCAAILRQSLPPRLFRAAALMQHNQSVADGQRPAISARL